MEESIKRPEPAQDQQAEATLSKINRELIAISSCNQLLIRATDESVLLRDICKVICEKAGYRLAWVGYVEHDEEKSVRPVAWFGNDEAYVTHASVSWDEHKERGQGSTGKAIRSGNSVFSVNLPQDPNDKPWSEEALKRGFQSSIALPMKNDEGVVFGALMLYSSELEILTPEEIRLLEELVADLAFGVMSIRLRAEHKRALEALRESEDHYRSLFDRVKDGVYRSTHEGRFVDINPAMVSMFGYKDKAEMLQADIKNDLYFAPEERDSSDLEIGMSNVEVFRMRRKDGSEIWVEDNGFYELDDNGKPLYHEGILRDVTERVRAEEDLRKAKEQVELSDRLKTVFLQNISHEIRTPMNAISGFTQLLNNPDLDHRELAEYAQIVQKNIDQLLAIITDIITISSLETRQVRVDRQLTSINDILDEKPFAFRKLLRERHCIMHLEKSLAEREALVYTDGHKLSEVLNHLISNALKFTQEGTVTVGYAVKDANLEFYVKDTGIGIAPDMLERIFDPFRKATNEPLVNISGTGLGLSISKGFVELMDGAFRVVSKQGRGSEFYFTIPYLSED